MNTPLQRGLVLLTACSVALSAGCSREEPATGHAADVPAPPAAPSAAEVRQGSGPPLSRDEWPLPVVELADELARRNIGPHPDSIEVRPANPEADNAFYDGFYWRMPADPATVQAHVEIFGLEPAEAGSPLTTRLLDFYPAAWPLPEGDDLEWYAWPHNRDDDPIRAHFWQVMLHDPQAETLTFFYWIWDVGI